MGLPFQPGPRSGRLPDWERAIAEYRLAGQLFPPTTPRSSISRWLCRRAGTTGARSPSSKGLVLAPHEPSFHLALGNSLARAGRSDASRVPPVSSRARGPDAAKVKAHIDTLGVSAAQPASRRRRTPRHPCLDSTGSLTVELEPIHHQLTCLVIPALHDSGADGRCRHRAGASLAEVAQKEEERRKTVSRPARCSRTRPRRCRRPCPSACRHESAQPRNRQARERRGRQQETPSRIRRIAAGRRSCDPSSNRIRSSPTPFRRASTLSADFVNRDDPRSAPSSRRIDSGRSSSSIDSPRRSPREESDCRS